MASVTITLSDWFVPDGTSWSTWEDSVSNSGVNISLGTSLSIDGATELFLGRIRFTQTGTAVTIGLASSLTGVYNQTGPDFSDQMEMSGTLTVTASDGTSLVLTGIGGSDEIEPYNWFVPDQQTELNALANAIASDLTGSVTVVFNDNAPDNVSPTADAGDNQSVAAGATVTLDGSGSSDSDGSISTYAWTQTAGTTVTLTGAATISPTFTAPSTADAQTLTFQLTVTDDDDATDTDTVNVAVAAVVVPSQGTVSIISGTPSITASGVTSTPIPLVLSDFDTSGLSMDWLALLEASGNSILYADSDRGGTGSPIDGELGLGDSDTVISRIRNLNSGANLSLNDNDNPEAITLSDYFGSGGDGNDLTIYLQTASDNVVSFPVTGNITTSGGGFVNFTIPSEVTTLINTITTGTRFLFGAGRPVQITVGESSITANAPTIIATGTTNTTASGSVSIAAGTPSISVAGTASTPTVLTLSDFDTSGLVMDWLALIEASGAVTLYADSDRGGTDSPLGGELGIGPDDTLISRIQNLNSGANLRLNDNNNPEGLTLTDYFGASGDGNDLTIYLQVEAGSRVSFTVSSSLSTAGGNFVNFTIPSEVTTLINTITTGTRFLFGAGRPSSISTSQGTVSIISGTPSITVSGSIVQTVMGSADLTTGTPSITGAGTTNTTSQGQTSMASGTPDLTVNGETSEPIEFQTFDLGSQPFGSGNDTSWEGAILINSELIEGGGVAYLRYFDPETSAVAFQLRLAVDQATNPSLPGPHFITDAEEGTFTLSEDGGTSIEFNGPNNSNNLVSSDADDPYSWIQNSDSEVYVWLQNLGTGNVTLTIKPVGGVEPVLSETVEGTTSLTTDAPSIAAAGTGIFNRQGQSSIAAGTPTLSAAGTRTFNIQGQSLIIAGTSILSASGIVPITASGQVFVVSGNSSIAATPTIQLVVEGSTTITSDSPSISINGSRVRNILGSTTIESGDPSLTVSGRTVQNVLGSTTIESGDPSLTVSGERIQQTVTGSILIRSGTSSLETVGATVLNQAPTANAGTGQSVAAGANVTLRGSGTDPDGTISSYAWTQISGTTVSLSGASTATASFTAPSNPNSSSLVFRFTVTDNDGAIGTDTVTIAVEAEVNLPPIASAGANQSVGAGANVTLNGAGSSDSDGSIVSYAWTQTSGPAVILSGASTTTATFSAPYNSIATTFVFRLTVTDNDGDTDTDDISISVSAVITTTDVPNDPDEPELEALSATSIRVSWSAPSSNGAVITSYNLRHRVTGTSSWTYVNNITTKSRDLTGLSTESRDVQINATNSEGTSGYSVTAVLDLGNIPGTPEIPDVEVLTINSLRVNWSPPNAGGSAISTYDLRYRRSGTSQWDITSDITGVIYVVPDILADNIYEVQIRAVNSYGAGPYSESSSQQYTILDVFVLDRDLFRGDESGARQYNNFRSKILNDHDHRIEGNEDLKPDELKLQSSITDPTKDGELRMVNNHLRFRIDGIVYTIALEGVTSVPPPAEN